MNLARLAPRIAERYMEKRHWTVAVGALVALVFGALALANRLSPFDEFRL